MNLQAAPVPVDPTPMSRIVRGYGLYEQLREHKPSKLLVFDQDGTQLEVNVPDVRQKHARVMQALKEVNWTRVDMLDKKGGLVYRHQRNADDRELPTGELEDISGGATSPRMADLAACMQIMLRGQEAVLSYTQRQTEQLFNAQQRMLEANSERHEHQVQQNQQILQLNHELSASLVRAQLAMLANTEQQGPHSDAAVNRILPDVLKAVLGPDRDERRERRAEKNEASRPKDEDRPVNGKTRSGGSGGSSSSSSSSSSSG